ncbi:MAG: M23 family metallopeptidase [Blautia sp.]
MRGSRGGYFYYAHLSSYGRAFQKGDRVSAGDLLGYMGDSGYGPEGTTGRFDVHLHIGIYIEGENRKEISVNPYWPLRYLEESIDFS